MFWPPRTNVGDAETRLPLLLLAVLVAVVWVPIFTNAILPLEDYVPHLSRVFVLHELLHGKGFADMYSWRWIIAPDLGVDAAALSLIELGVPAEMAGRIVIAVVAVLPASGVMALHRVSFGRWSIWPLFSLVFAYDPVFFAGYVSYLLGLGLLFWTVALWRPLARRGDWRALIVLAVAAPVLFFCHLTALLLLFGMVGGCGLLDLVGTPTADADSARTPARSARAMTLLFGLVICLLPLPLLKLAPLLTQPGPAGGGFALPAFHWRALNLFSFAFTYRPIVDVVTLAVCGVVALYALVRRVMQLDPGLMLCAAGLTAIYFVLGDGWYGTADLPGRLPRAIAMLLIAGSDVRCVARQWRLTVVAVLVVLVSVRSFVVDRAWANANDIFRPLLAVLDQVPEGSRLTSVLAYKDSMNYVAAYLGAKDHPEYPPTFTLPSYEVIRRHAFAGTTFAIPTQNLVIRQPLYDAAPLPSWYRADRPAVLNESEDPFSKARLDFFDYILVINPDYFPVTPPPVAHLLIRGEHYALYKIDHA